MSASYQLQIDHCTYRAGPLALIVPQAAQAASTTTSLVRIRDHTGQAARLERAANGLLATWDQPNELFPRSDTQPPWIERLRVLLVDLGFT